VRWSSVLGRVEGGTAGLHGLRCCGGNGVTYSEEDGAGVGWQGWGRGVGGSAMHAEGENVKHALYS